MTWFGYMTIYHLPVGRSTVIVRFDSPIFRYKEQSLLNAKFRFGRNFEISLCLNFEISDAKREEQGLLVFRSLAIETDDDC